MAKRKKARGSTESQIETRQSAHQNAKKVSKRAAAPKRAKKTRSPSKGSARTVERAQVRQPKQPPTPAIEDTIIDVIDEPVPGVLRVTEIEEIRVATTDSEQGDEEE